MSCRCQALLALLAVAAPAGLLLAADKSALTDKDLRSCVDRRIQEWQPTTEEKRFDQIGWCTSLVQAEKHAREHKRPIFLFTHDGKMQVGRC